MRERAHTRTHPRLRRDPRTVGRRKRVPRTRATLQCDRARVQTSGTHAVDTACVWVCLCGSVGTRQQVWATRNTCADLSLEHMNARLYTCGMGGARYLLRRMAALAPAASHESSSLLQHLCNPAALLPSTDGTLHTARLAFTAGAPRQQHWPTRRRGPLLDHHTGCTAGRRDRNQR